MIVRNGPPPGGKPPGGKPPSDSKPPAPTTAPPSGNVTDAERDALRDAYKRLRAALDPDTQRAQALVAAALAARHVEQPSPADWLATVADLVRERADGARAAESARADALAKQVDDLQTALAGARAAAVSAATVASGHGGYVGVQGAAGAELARMCGWSVTGETDPDALRDAWEQEGLDPDWLPDACSMTLAVRLAVDKHRRAGYRVTVSPARQRGVRVLVVADEHGASVQLVAKVRRPPAGSGIKPTLEITPTGHPLAPTIEAEWARLQGVLTSGQVGTWIGSVMVGHLDATLGALGRGNAIVPPEHGDTLRRIEHALRRATSHRIRSLPVMRSEDAIAGILANLADAARASADEAHEALAKHAAALAGGAVASGTGKLGTRALKSGAQSLADEAARLGRWEARLGVAAGGLQDVYDALESVRTAYTAACLAEQDRKAREARK